MSTLGFPSSGLLPIPDDAQYKRSLDGEWRFKLEQAGTDFVPRRLDAREPITTPATFEPFYAPDYEEDDSWHDLDVPGTWEMAGLSPATYDQPDNASGFYRVWIDVPNEWEDRQVRIDFDHPRGWNVVTCRFDLVESESPKRPTMGADLPQGLGFPALNLVRNITAGDPYMWNKATRFRGSLVNVKIYPAGADELPKVRSMDTDVVLDNDPDTVVARIHAEYADGWFSYRLDWLSEKSDIQELGWTFEMPRAFDRFSWKRQAHWSYYPKTHIGRPVGTALPDSADVRNTNVNRPDAFDFNSTKYDCDWASLTDSSGRGLAVEFEADQRHHCKGGFGLNDEYQLIVNKQCSPPRDISSHQVPELYLMLDAGDSVEGSFHIGSM